MLIFCSICKELFLPNSDVCGTKCGHVYHESCLKKWQERSESCPQCRTKIKDKPHRIYFDIEDSPEFEVETDSAALKHKVDSMREYIADMKKKNQELEDAFASVQKELVGYTEKASSYEDSLKALRHRVRELSDETKQLEPLRKANEVLKLRLKNFSNLEIVLKGTESDVCKLVNKTPVTPLAVHQLCTYVGVLKNQLNVKDKKYRREHERLITEYTNIKKKLRDLQGGYHNREIQTEEDYEPQSNELKLSSGVLLKKRSYAVKPVLKCDNKPRHSRNDSDCEPPIKKKHHSLTCKKVINNLEKTLRKDIPSDSDEDLIYAGPSSCKRSAAGLDSKRLFKKLVTHERRSK